MKYLALLFLFFSLSASAQRKGLYLGFDVMPGVTDNSGHTYAPAEIIPWISGGGSLHYMLHENFGVGSGIYYSPYTYRVYGNSYGNDEIRLWKQRLDYLEIPFFIRVEAGRGGGSRPVWFFAELGSNLCLLMNAEARDGRTFRFKGEEKQVTGDNKTDFRQTTLKPFVALGFVRPLNPNLDLMIGWQFGSTFRNENIIDPRDYRNSHTQLLTASLKLGLSFHIGASSSKWW